MKLLQISILTLYFLFLLGCVVKDIAMVPVDIATTTISIGAKTSGAAIDMISGDEEE